MNLDWLKLLDPYYHFDRWWEKNVGKGGAIKLLADLLFTVFLAVVIYTLMGVILHTPRPAVIVASSSMEPVFYPGDIVIVRGIDPAEISAPEVDLNLPYNFHVLPSQAGIRFVREGIELTGIEVNGMFFPVEDNGTVIVYYDDVRGRDIIHRVLLKIRTPHGYFFVTKGDNGETNPTADQDCILGRCVYPFLVSEEQVLGTPIFTIPRIGIIKLLLIPS